MTHMQLYRQKYRRTCKNKETNFNTYGNTHTYILWHMLLYRQKYGQTYKYNDKITNTYAIIQSDIPPHPSGQIVEAEEGNQEWWGGDWDKVDSCTVHVTL